MLSKLLKSPVIYKELVLNFQVVSLPLASVIPGSGGSRLLCSDQHLDRSRRIPICVGKGSGQLGVVKSDEQ